jgi:hypothetical protein
VWHYCNYIKTLLLHGGRVEPAKPFAIHFEVVACFTPCQVMLYVVPPVICFLSEIGTWQRRACVY